MILNLMFSNLSNRFVDFFFLKSGPYYSRIVSVLFVLRCRLLYNI